MPDFPAASRFFAKANSVLLFCFQPILQTFPEKVRHGSSMLWIRQYGNAVKCSTWRVQRF